MFERYEGDDAVNVSNYSFNDADIPHAVEHWSLDDFEDVLSDRLK